VSVASCLGPPPRARSSVRNSASWRRGRAISASTASSPRAPRCRAAVSTNAFVTAAVVTAKKLNPASIPTAAVARPATEAGTTSA